MKSVPSVQLGEIAKPIQRPVAVVPGTAYRTLGVKWWGEGAYERETIDGSQTAAGTLYEVQQDDLIINKIWVRHGSVAIVGPEVHGCTGSNEFPTFTLDRQRVLPRWVHWYTKTRDLRQKCDALSQGTSGKNRIRPERFLTVTIPLPTLPQQRRIVAKVEALAAKIEEARGLRDRVAADLGALVLSLHFHLATGRKVQVKDILTLAEKRKPICPGQEYPQVGINSFGRGLFVRPAVTATDTTYKYFNRLEAGMLVLSQVKGWEGAVAICPDTMTGYFASPEYRTFRCIPGQSRPDYLESLVITPWFRKLLQDATHGVGARRERVRPEQFLTLELPMPTIEQQKQAVDVFSRLRSIPILQSQSQAELDALLPSILDTAFKGEL